MTDTGNHVTTPLAPNGRDRRAGPRRGRSGGRRTIIVVGVAAALLAGSGVVASQLANPDADDRPTLRDAAPSDVSVVAAATGAASATVTDAGGDAVLTVGEVEAGSMSVAGDGMVTATVTVDEWTDPTGDDWRFGETGPTWWIDTDDDGTGDHRAEVRVRNDELQTVIFAGSEIVCLGGVGSDSAASAYSATFDTACVGNPQSLRFHAEMTYEDVVFDLSGTDRAPDTGWSSSITNPAFVPPIVTIDPFRFADTRTTNERLGERGTLEVVAVGRGGVPADARAVFLNVTAVRPDGPGFVTVFPCGFDQPTASNLNYQPGDVRPNAVLAQVGLEGKVCLFSRSATDLVVDVNGYVPARSDVRSVPPQRYLDTRSDGGRVAAGSTTEIPVLDRFGVPADADGVVLNVTAVNPSAPGFLTVLPCGSEVPLASNVNYRPGDVVPNAVVAKVGVGGAVCVFSLAETDLVVDVNGYIPGGSTVRPVDPARVYDSRNSGGPIPGGDVVELDVLSAPGVAADASGVVLNVTAVGAVAPGFVTIFPCGTERPEASNLNYAPGTVVPNAVVAKVGAGGKVCAFVLGTTHLVVDVNGYLP